MCPLLNASGGERGSHSPFPKPVAGAVIATSSGKILSTGRSSYEMDAVQAAIANAGIVATPLTEWCVSWPSNKQLRSDLRNSTLYVTLEPSSRRQGQTLPPITQLIQMSGIPRVVIGCPDPVAELASEGAASLHSAGLDVIMGIEEATCESLIREYSRLANSKLQKMARKHFSKFGRPLGFLHCSVVDSDDVHAYARNGNSFGKDFGGQRLSFREVRQGLYLV
jgi:pyrimidine deaminase RibD-like protein